MKDNILIFGASGHSSVLVDIVENEELYNIVGYIDNDESKHNKSFLGYRILGSKKDLREICDKYDVHKGIVAIGNNWKRFLISEMIKEVYPQFEFVTIVHPSAQIAKRVKIGKGTAIMAGAIINSNAEIGDHCIVNSGCIIEHDCKIMDTSSLAPGVVIGGNVNIGLNTAVSIGAVVKNNIDIGNYSVVGAGAVVVRNIADNVVAYGSPARVVRKRNKEDEYLK